MFILDAVEKILKDAHNNDIALAATNHYDYDYGYDYY